MKNIVDTLQDFGTASAEVWYEKPEWESNKADTVATIPMSGVLSPHVVPVSIPRRGQDANITLGRPEGMGRGGR